LNGIHRPKRLWRVGAVVPLAVALTACNPGLISVVNNGGDLNIHDQASVTLYCGTSSDCTGAGHGTLADPKNSGKETPFRILPGSEGTTATTKYGDSCTQAPCPADAYARVTGDALFGATTYSFTLSVHDADSKVSPDPEGFDLEIYDYANRANFDHTWSFRCSNCAEVIMQVNRA